MRHDIENQLCVAQAFTGAATVSTNSYMLGAAGQDISVGPRRMSLMAVATVAAGAGSTHTFEVIQADNAALTTNVQSLNTVTVLAANLTPGKEIEIPIPQTTITKQYLGFRETATGGTTTVTLDVYLMPADEIYNFKSFKNVTPVGL